MTSKIPTINKRRQVVLFSSTAIALYGDDQGLPLMDLRDAASL
jgi:hypothetical protein